MSWFKKAHPRAAGPEGASSYYGSGSDKLVAEGLKSETIKPFYAIEARLLVVDFYTLDLRS